MRIIKKILGIFCLIMLITEVFLLFSEKASRGGTIMTIVLFGVLAHILLFRKEKKAGTTNITLMREKITDMVIKTDTEIQKQIVSSTGGAIAGAVLFGPLGAIIGGRAKTIKTHTSYLIITYKDDNGDLAYIGFDTKGSLKQFKLINEFKKLNTTEGFNIRL